MYFLYPYIFNYFYLKLILLIIEYEFFFVSNLLLVPYKLYCDIFIDLLNYFIYSSLPISLISDFSEGEDHYLSSANYLSSLEFNRAYFLI